MGAYARTGVVDAGLGGVPPFGRVSILALLQAHLNDAPPRVTDVRPDLPAALEHVLARAMAKDPAERFPSANAFAAALATVLGVDDAALVPAEQSQTGYVIVGVDEPSTRAV